MCLDGAGIDDGEVGGVTGGVTGTPGAAALDGVGVGAGAELGSIELSDGVVGGVVMDGDVGQATLLAVAVEIEVSLVEWKCCGADGDVLCLDGAGIRIVVCHGHCHIFA